MKLEDSVPDEPAVDPHQPVEKIGRTLHLPFDPDPTVGSYMLLAPPGGMLVLLPKNAAAPEPGGPAVEAGVGDRRESILRNAFAALAPLIGESPWTRSATPFDDVVAGFEALLRQPEVNADVNAYLDRNPVTRHSVEMLFTSMAMSARARWQDTPTDVRGVAARGWFLGRWLPTFLVIDGPIQRFLGSDAFKRQKPRVDVMRHVRRFLQEPKFLLVRHAFAHWSFEWDVRDGESVIVAHPTTGHEAEEPLSVTRGQADAFHIATFSVVEAMHDVFLRDPRRAGRPSGR